MEFRPDQYTIASFGDESFIPVSHDYNYEERFHWCKGAESQNSAPLLHLQPSFNDILNSISLSRCHCPSSSSEERRRSISKQL